MPLTYLNIYDAPHELSDDALKLRLDKYCTVFSTRRGKFSNSHVYNGIRHYRVRVKNPIPSYLRFGKFLVRLSHDGQQHTCRRCNRAGHFANECQNTVCFNCEELGHVSRDCEEGIRCCICKSTEHFARRCPYSWYQAPPPPQVPGPSSTENVTHSATGNAADNVADDVVEEIPAGDFSGSPVGDSVPLDNLSRDRVSPQDPDNPDPSLADGSSGQPSVLSSNEHLLDSQGFIWDQIANRMREQGLAPNPPGPQSSPSPAESLDVDVMNPDLIQPALDVQPPDNSPPDVSMNSAPSVPPSPLMVLRKPHLLLMPLWYLGSHPRVFSLHGVNLPPCRQPWKRWVANQPDHPYPFPGENLVQWTPLLLLPRMIALNPKIWTLSFTPP